jgi:hypothetical protein
MEQDSQTDFFDDDKLVSLARQFIETRERLKQESRLDASRIPTPSLLAKELHVTIEDLDQIQDFAENYLGEYEREVVERRAVGFLDVDGNAIDPYARE